MHCEHILRVVLLDLDLLRERRGVLSGAALLTEATTGRVHQDVSHGLGRGGEEVGAVTPARPLLGGELEIRLVDQAGGVEGVAAPKQQLRVGESSQMVVDQRHQPREGLLVSFTTRLEKRREVGVIGMRRLLGGIGGIGHLGRGSGARVSNRTGTARGYPTTCRCSPPPVADLSNENEAAQRPPRVLPFAAATGTPVVRSRTGTSPPAAGDGDRRNGAAYRSWHCCACSGSRIPSARRTR